MMKRKKISRFLAIGLCGAVLAGCSTNNDDTTDTSAPESEETQSAVTMSSESSSATSEASSSATSEETDGSEESTNSSTDQESEATSSQESVDVSSELKMNSDTVLLPTDLFLASRKCKKRQLKMYAGILSFFTCYLIWIACICGFRH